MSVDDEGLEGAALEGARKLLNGGYNDVVAAFTRSISSDPGMVMRLETAFDRLTFDNLISWNSTSSQDAFYERLDESVESLYAFLGDPENSAHLFLRFTNHGPSATCEVGWIHAGTGPVVWDRWTAEVDDPVIAYADAGHLFSSKSYRCASAQTERPLPPLYRYHPERFKAFRAYAEALGKLYRHRVEARTGLLTLPQLNEIADLLSAESNDKGLQYPRRWKETTPSPLDVLAAEHNVATAYGRFVQAGRQILDFPPALTAMLAKTDVEGIPLDSIKLPYSCQYMHFGPQVDLEMEPGWLVDGAYVETRGTAGDIRFTVTTVPKDSKAAEHWYVFGEVEYSQDFVVEYRTMDLGTAIDTVLSQNVADFQRRQQLPGGDITPQLETAADERGLSVPEGHTVLDVRPRMAEIREATAMRRHPVYKAALQLVVNALCYATAYPDDIESVWPQGTPESLKAKLSSPKAKEQARARSKLASMGYVPIHLCGRRLAQDPRTTVDPASSHIATHWRRGHWRNQVHGPGRSLRKLIWLMPVLVGGSDGESPESGHVYLVS